MTLRLTANTVDATATGDYYQVVFDSQTRAEREASDPFGDSAPYLLIQCQFEFADGGLCYVESDREEDIGRFKLELREFTPTQLAFNMQKPDGQHRWEVAYTLSKAEFENALPTVEVIFGKRDPDSEDQSFG